MAGPQPDWKGLFEWSMKYHDGTQPSQFEGRTVSEEDRKWFQEAMAQHMVDVGARMREIKNTLDQPEVANTAVQDKEALLDELMEIVENIDYARDLAKIGGLPTLLGLLGSPHPSLRSRAAEVSATCVQSNPPVQDWFMQAGAMPKLLHLYQDEDATCRTKALLALSCLVRHNPTGLEAFRQAGGFKQLVAGLEDPEPRAQRKALQLLGHILQERPSDATEACRLGLPHALCALVDHADNDMRHASLAVAKELARDPATLHCLRQETCLQDHLRNAEATFQAGDVEDLDAVKEEVALCQHLLRVLSQPVQHAEQGAAEDLPSPGRAAGMQLSIVPSSEETPVSNTTAVTH